MFNQRSVISAHRSVNALVRELRAYKRSHVVMLTFAATPLGVITVPGDSDLETCRLLIERLHDNLDQVDRIGHSSVWDQGRVAAITELLLTLLLGL